MRTWGTGLGVVVTVMSIIAGVILVDERYASLQSLERVQDNVTRVETRLDYKIKDDQAMALRQNIWDVTAHYCQVPAYCQPQERAGMPHPVQRQLATMQSEVSRLEGELLSMRNGDK